MLTAGRVLRRWNHATPGRVGVFGSNHRGAASRGSMSQPRAFSVQSKLLAAFVLLTVTAITVLTAVGYLTARASLTATVERQLLGLQRSKAGIVKAMLTSMRNEVLAFSASEAMATAATSMRAAYRDLRADAVTPEMTEAVRRFHLDEFSPAVAKRLAVAPAEGWSLPTSPREWYLHYHYLATAPKPYAQSRLLSSSTDTSAYARALAQTQAAAGPAHGPARVRQRPPRRSRHAGSLLQLPGVDDHRHEPRQWPVRLEQRRRPGARPEHVEGRRRLPRRRLRGIPAAAGRPARVHRHAGVRRPADRRRHAAPVPARPDCRRALGRAAVGGGRARQDRPGLPDRPRPDDADRLALPDRGPEGVHPDPSPIEAHHAHGRRRRTIEHDHPDRAGEARGDGGGAARPERPDGGRGLPRRRRADGVRPRGPRFAALGRDREDRPERGAGAADDLYPPGAGRRRRARPARLGGGACSWPRR